jgi:hypothetical protein
MTLAIETALTAAMRLIAPNHNVTTVAFGVTVIDVLNRTLSATGSLNVTTEPMNKTVLALRVSTATNVSLVDDVTKGPVRCAHVQKATRIGSAAMMARVTPVRVKPNVLVLTSSLMESASRQ